MRILTVDVETSPHISVHWGRWQQNIPPEFTLSESHIICWAAKWYGEREVMFDAEWNGEDFLNNLWHLMDEADVVLGFNSKKFDVKKINTEFVLRGWQPPSPYAQIDVLQQIKKHFNFSSNRLKHLLKDLGLTPKLEDNANMSLWIDAWHRGIKSEQQRMEKYNKQDVRSTEELYDYILGWIDNHPNWGLYVDDRGEDRICPNCGGRHVNICKKRRTKVRTYNQYQCQDCGHYARGRKSLDEGGVENGVLA